MVIMTLGLGSAAQLTVEGVAEFLNVSAPYVIALLNAGELPSLDVNGSQQVAAADVAEFKRRDDAQRRHLLDELTAEAEAYCLGY